MLVNMQIGQNLLDKQITLIMLVLTVRIGASKSLFRALHACSIRCAMLTSQQTWPLWTIHFETFWSKNNAPAKPQASSSLHAIPHLIKFHFWMKIDKISFLQFRSICIEKTSGVKIRRCENQNFTSCISLQNSFHFNPFLCSLYRTHTYTGGVPC